MVSCLLIFFVVLDLTYGATIDVNAVGGQVFQRIDTDHDGQVDESEMDRLIRTFDANGDKVVSCNEFKAASSLPDTIAHDIYDYYDNDCSCKLTNNYLKGILNGMDDDSDKTLSEQEFRHHFSEVVKVLEHMDKHHEEQVFSCQDLILVVMNAYLNFDVNKDSHLTKAEIQAIVGHFDKNGDQNITCYEFFNESSLPRNLSRFIYFNYDQDSDCLIHTTNIEQILEGMDNDGDKQVSQSEFQHDFISVVKQLQHGANAHHGQNKSIDLPRLVHSKFAELDTNGDGSMDVAEIQAVVTAWDNDGDKSVQCNEYIADSHFPVELSREIFFFNDNDGDCSIPNAVVMSIVKGMDTDGNGLVSEAEYLKALSQIHAASS